MPRASDVMIIPYAAAGYKPHIDIKRHFLYRKLTVFKTDIRRIEPGMDLMPGSYL